jgi:hypothetical protein
MAATMALLLSPAWVMAKGRVIIKHAYQLERAPALVRVHREYEALVSASVFYDQCGAELGTTEEQKTFLKKKFTDTAAAYQIAYQDAYVEYVGAMPNQAMVDDIVATIKARQQRLVNDMTQNIRSWKCENRNFYPIRSYFKKLHAANSAPPPSEPALVEPKADFSRKK